MSKLAYVSKRKKKQSSAEQRNARRRAAYARQRAAIEAQEQEQAAQRAQEARGAAKTEMVLRWGTDDPTGRLRAISRRLKALEYERARLIDERDLLIGFARELGWSWDKLGDAAGVSRQALLQRRGQ